jgi:broad specificity phosphatase PhoE
MVLRFHTLVMAAALTCSLMSTAAQAHKGIFVVRHAEKASSTDPDTPLSMQGEDRASALARVLRNAGVTHVFASEKQRTQQTVQPLVDQKGLKITVVAAAKGAELLAKLKAVPADAVVLVSGHSDTIPAILAGLGVKAPVKLRDDQYGRLFLVTESAQLIELAY